MAIAACACTVSAVACADAEALQARGAALRQDLAQNAFQRPLHLASTESSERVKGEAVGLVRQPFSAAATLAGAASWCDLLTLHLNTKQCRSSGTEGNTMLHLVIGKKFDQPVEDAYRVNFRYTVVASTPAYLHVTLDAAEGPLGTRDYRIALEATPALDGQTLIRLSYSYGYGIVGKLAMQSYLGTIARDKVGFTVTGKDTAGRDKYIGGMRALVERNTMRYYLALEAYLAASPLPSAARTEKSLHDWFAACERFPRQLHEMERNEYLAMKRREFARQRAGS